MKLGQRVQPHPATDHWMRGDRYGTVVGIRKNFMTGALVHVLVKLDKSGKTVQVYAVNVEAID